RRGVFDRQSCRFVRRDREEHQLVVLPTEHPLAIVTDGGSQPVVVVVEEDISIFEEDGPVPLRAIEGNAKEIVGSEAGGPRLLRHPVRVEGDVLAEQAAEVKKVLW